MKELISTKQEGRRVNVQLDPRTKHPCRLREAETPLAGCAAFKGTQENVNRTPVPPHQLFSGNQTRITWNLSRLQAYSCSWQLLESLLHLYRDPILGIRWVGIHQRTVYDRYGYWSSVDDIHSWQACLAWVTEMCSIVRIRYNYLEIPSGLHIRLHSIYVKYLILTYVFPLVFYNLYLVFSFIVIIYAFECNGQKW